MNQRNSQSPLSQSGVTVRFATPIGLARNQRDRLWTGLERFVNCGDSLGDFTALGKAFPDFWPIKIDRKEFQITGYTELQNRQEYVTDDLAWHPVCQQLFVVYRDMLRIIWAKQRKPDSEHYSGFLLGADASNERVVLEIRDEASPKLYSQDQKYLAIDTLSWPLHSNPMLVAAWKFILSRSPGAAPSSAVRVQARWPQGDFYMVPQNDFQRAFYLLFGQSWRARICRRCKNFFIARRPKQGFCGTVCSGGSRLASKRKWWNSVGTKRRSNKEKTGSNQNRKGRKRP